MLESVTKFPIIFQIAHKVSNYSALSITQRKMQHFFLLSVSITLISSLITSFFTIFDAITFLSNRRRREREILR